MSGTPEQEPQRDDPLIAAEWALGLLEGEELLAARARHAIEPDFAWRKEWWDNWFAPLADEIAPAEPGAQVWERIAEAVNAPAPVAAEVVMLERRVKRWQIVSVLTSAAAAIALIVSLSGPAATPPPAPSPLVASVPVGDNAVRLDLTYLPASDQLLVSAAGLTADGVHDHELWLVPGDGSALQSLGVVTPGTVQRRALPAAITRHLKGGAAVLLTREPLGGRPAGVDAGPVVARGAFAPV